MALKYPLKLTLDEDFILPVVWKTKTGNTVSLVDLTPYTIDIAFYATTSTIPLVTFPCTKANATGEITLLLTAEQIAALPASVANYKIRAYGAGSRVLLSGRVTVMAG